MTSASEPTTTTTTSVRRVLKLGGMHVPIEMLAPKETDNGEITMQHVCICKTCKPNNDLYDPQGLAHCMIEIGDRLSKSKEFQTQTFAGAMATHFPNREVANYKVIFNIIRCHKQKAFWMHIVAMKQ